ncbi:AbrB/MazE/SpoVT family DNA-binding domain-containing protein [Thermodesulfatator indicus]
MLVKKTSKNQITLPKEIIKNFPKIEYFEAKVEEGKIILIPVKVVPANITLEKIREKIERLGITEKDVEDAVKWARKN